MTQHATFTMLAGAVLAVVILPACGTTGTQGGSSPQPSPAGTATATAGISPATASGTPRSTTDAAGNRTVAISGEINYKITQNGEEVTVVCTGGGDVNVDSTNARVTMTGDCRKLEIDGDVNTVTAEQIQEIRIDGDTNTVNAEQVDEVEIKGTENTAGLGTVNELRLEGRGNAVTYQGGSPTTENKGSDNSISGTPR